MFLMELLVKQLFVLKYFVKVLLKLSKVNYIISLLSLRFQNF